MSYTKMRREDRQISREAALEAVDRAVYGTLSMTAPDGSPYAAALNFVRDGEKLYFHAAFEGLKTDALRRNPAVCALFVDNAVLNEPEFTTYYTSALVRGTAHEVTDTAEKQRALTLLCAKFVPSLPEESARRAAAGPAYTAIWCVEIESVTGKESRPK